MRCGWRLTSAQRFVTLSPISRYGHASPSGPYLSMEPHAICQKKKDPSTSTKNPSKINPSMMNPSARNYSRCHDIGQAIGGKIGPQITTHGGLLVNLTQHNHQPPHFPLILSNKIAFFWSLRGPSEGPACGGGVVKIRRRPGVEELAGAGHQVALLPKVLRQRVPLRHFAVHFLLNTPGKRGNFHMFRLRITETTRKAHTSAPTASSRKWLTNDHAFVASGRRPLMKEFREGEQ